MSRQFIKAFTVMLLQANWTIRISYLIQRPSVNVSVLNEMVPCC